jgi:hypothetical protein
MFEVRITAEAIAILDRRIDRGDQEFGLVVRRVGRAGDNLRDTNGQPAWSFEEKYPWDIRIARIPEGASRVVVADGIKVYLPFISAASELGIVVTAKEGQLHVQTIDA